MWVIQIWHPYNLVKIEWYHYELAIWWLLHNPPSPRFVRSENKKWLFGARKRKTSSSNIICHSMMNMHARYGHIITNYVLILAIILVIWPESQETSNEIGHFVKVFWDIFNIISLIFFLAIISHNMTPHEGFAMFRSFLIFYDSFKLSTNFVERRV